MTTRITMNISLPETMRAWVEARVSTGAYANASDYVRDLIRHDQETHKEEFDPDTLAALREGLSDVMAGRARPAEKVFLRLEERYDAE